MGWDKISFYCFSQEIQTLDISARFHSKTWPCYTTLHTRVPDWSFLPQTGSLFVGATICLKMTRESGSDPTLNRSMTLTFIFMVQNQFDFKPNGLWCSRMRFKTSISVLFLRDLNYNSLVEFPSAIRSLSHLKELWVWRFCSGSSQVLHCRVSRS